ncbi:MAG: bifunctional 4-hydroxy-2-oxoglutarate aldolase/2-dehydro-3-deoxy-phosphogluconate aldolase [Defluviitaleaceae bacterium]|nr:bifunctional 4-hydroxy-2-oxoglutarate aldolase/2-dehydro-3-deoxy-phosphogluconate aldolase [Defluviitaleaceae bacterium]
MDLIMEQISKIGIVPVVKLDSAKDAVPLAEALIAGGLACAEITFRTNAAEESIKNISQKFPEMLVGAGTVLTLEQLDKAINAGAKFIVAPGFNPEIVKACIAKKIPVAPGCSNPSDMEGAMALGLRTVKFFPAENVGGIAAIKAMSAPYGDLTFMPTGGVNSKNINDYLSFPKVIACGGSWMVDPKLIASGDFAEITRLTREAVNTVLGFTLAHIGVNCETDEKTHDVAKLFCNLFGFDYKPGNSSVFAGSVLETMTPLPGRGKHGHIAIATNYIDRAMYQLSQKGAKFLQETAKKDAQGNLKAIYLDLEFSGFAVHLLQK